MTERGETESQVQKSIPFLLLHRPTRSEVFQSAALLLGLLMCIRWQGLLSLPTHFIGGSSRDAGLYVWLSQSVSRDLFRLPWFLTQAFYPYAGTLAWSDNFILVGIVAKLLFAMGFSLPVTFNIILLAAQFLNGFCTYYFAYKLTGVQVAAVVSGAVFLSLSYFSGNLGHPQLEFAFWFPITFSLLFSFLNRPTYVSGILMGLSIVGAFLTTVYFALFTLIGMGVLGAGVVVLRPDHFTLKDLLRLATGFIIGILPVLPFLPPYLSVRDAFGERALYEAYYFSATALSYLAFSPFNVMYHWTSSFSHDEALLGSGIFLMVFAGIAFFRAFGALRLRRLVLVFLSFFVCTCIFSLNSIHLIPGLNNAIPNYLCVISMWGASASIIALLWHLGELEKSLHARYFTNRNLMALFFTLGVLAFMLSLGPQGNPEKGHVALGVHRVLYEILPGFNSIRAISRIGILVLFSLTILLALILTYFRNSLKWKKGMLVAIGFAILLENVPYAIPVEELAKSPSVLDELRKEARPEDVVLFLPMAPGLTPNGQVRSWGDFAMVNTIYMNWLFPLDLPLVNGYSGQRSKLMREYPGQLARFPDARSLQAIATIAGLRYIVFASQFSPLFNGPQFTQAFENFPESLRYIKGDEAGNYLFEYTGTQNLSMEGFSLWVPSVPPRSIDFELKALYDSKVPEVSLDIMIPDLIPDIAFHTYRVPSNGEWSVYHLELPASADAVRPQRITFYPSPPDTQIFLRHTRVSAPLRNQ